MDLLRLDSITKIFGGLTALDNVSFSVAPGSITGIIGPNGAGKTTLFNIITGLYIQTSGEVFLEEQNISFLKTEEMAPLGLVRTFQNIELFGRMTVLENVMVGMHTGSRSGMVSCALKLPGHIREEKYIREKAWSGSNLPGWKIWPICRQRACLSARGDFWKFQSAGGRSQNYSHG